MFIYLIERVKKNCMSMKRTIKTHHWIMQLTKMNGAVLGRISAVYCKSKCNSIHIYVG